MTFTEEHVQFQLDQLKNLFAEHDLHHERIHPENGQFHLDGKVMHSNKVHRIAPKMHSAHKPINQEVSVRLHLYVPEEFPEKQLALTMSEFEGLSEHQWNELHSELLQHFEEKLPYNSELRPCFEFAHQLLTNKTLANAECALCKHKLQPHDVHVRTPCMHSLHAYCLKKWLPTAENAKACPACQQEYDLGSLVPADLETYPQPKAEKKLEDVQKNEEEEEKRDEQINKDIPEAEAEKKESAETIQLEAEKCEKEAPKDVQSAEVQQCDQSEMAQPKMSEQVVDKCDLEKMEQPKESCKDHQKNFDDEKKVEVTKDAEELKLCEKKLGHELESKKMDSIVEQSDKLSSESLEKSSNDVVLAEASSSYKNVQNQLSEAEKKRKRRVRRRKTKNGKSTSSITESDDSSTKENGKSSEQPSSSTDRLSNGKQYFHRENNFYNRPRYSSSYGHEFNNYDSSRPMRRPMYQQSLELNQNAYYDTDRLLNGPRDRVGYFAARVYRPTSAASDMDSALEQRPSQYTNQYRGQRQMPPPHRDSVQGQYQQQHMQYSQLGYGQLHQQQYFGPQNNYRRNYNNYQPRNTYQPHYQQKHFYANKQGGRTYNSVSTYGNYYGNVMPLENLNDAPNQNALVNGSAEEMRSQMNKIMQFRSNTRRTRLDNRDSKHGSDESQVQEISSEHSNSVQPEPSSESVHIPENQNNVVEQVSQVSAN